MMLALVWQSIRVLTACVLVTMFAVPQNLAAQVHVVSPAELQNQTLAASQRRQRNLEIVTRFLSSPTAEKAMRIVHTNDKQVKAAVANLNDQELGRLAQRAQKAEADFAAGSLSDRELLIILIAVLVLVVIILAATH
jgi:hypothetical protein